MRLRPRAFEIDDVLDEMDGERHEVCWHGGARLVRIADVSGDE